MVDKKTVSFMRSLCMGQIEEDVILPFPTIPTAEKETLQGVVSSLEQLLGPRQEDFRHWDRAGEFPPEFIEELKSAGLFSFVIPEEHGGLAFGSSAYSRALQQVAQHDASVAVTAAEPLVDDGGGASAPAGSDFFSRKMIFFSSGGSLRRASWKNTPPGLRRRVPSASIIPPPFSTSLVSASSASAPSSPSTRTIPEICERGISSTSPSDFAI